MIVIGIYAPGHQRRIAELVQEIFHQSGKRTAVTDKSRGGAYLEYLSAAKLDAVILLLHPNELPKAYFDVLIMELSHSVYLPELAKCLHRETRLIYNEDAFFFPVVHPNAISYGMRYDAAATVSSIESAEETTVAYCLQKPIRKLSGELAEEGELLIHRSVPMEKSLSDLLAAVTCGIVCGVIRTPTVKI